MNTVFALMADLWSHVGPGVLLAFALPILVLFLGVIVQSGVRRVRSR